MNKKAWRIWFGLGLAALSAVLFAAHYLVFRDLHHLGIFTLHDLAFLPLEVLIVTLIIHATLEARERRELFQKLNMVIDAFFSETGIELLECLAEFDTQRDHLAKHFTVSEGWTSQQFDAAAKVAGQHDFHLAPTREGTLELRELLMGQRQFLLRLLENPNLLEDERFTDALWAVFHLGDELKRRKDLRAVPESDFAHLTLDMERAYRCLIVEWLQHLRHLKARYPYLYSIAIRTNPLISDGSVEVVA